MTSSARAGHCPGCGARGALAADCPCGRAFVGDDAFARGDADPLLGRVFEERFVLLGLFATGAMAGVYDALDRRDGRRVVVKVLRSDGPAGDEALAFAEAEASALGGASPHLVRLLAHGEVRGALAHGASFAYLALEALGPRAFGPGAHPPRVVVPALSHALAGLASLHGRAWIHGDVKTAHLLKRPAPRAGEPPIAWIDLGAARRLGAALVAGSRGYAPSASPRLPASPSVDLFGLGCVAHELLTGRLPPARAVAAGLSEVGVEPALARWVSGLVEPGASAHASAISAATSLAQVAR